METKSCNMECMIVSIEFLKYSGLEFGIRESCSPTVETKSDLNHGKGSENVFFKRCLFSMSKSLQNHTE
jgi:hypothetical protein